MVCIRYANSVLCFDPDDVKQVLEKCAEKHSMDECLKNTGWDRFADILKKYGVIP